MFRSLFVVVVFLRAVLTEKGVRIILLLHLCPIIPFNVLNLIGGTSSMAALTYAWTLLAILPGTIVYTFLGATASSLTLHQHPGTSASLWEIVSIVVGITLGTIGIATMSYYAKQELRKVRVFLFWICSSYFVSCSIASSSASF